VEEKKEIFKKKRKAGFKAALLRRAVPLEFIPHLMRNENDMLND